MDIRLLKKHETYTFLRKPGFYLGAGVFALTTVSILGFNYIVGFIFPKGTIGDKNANLETLKFIVYLIGGLLLIWQIYLTNRRTKAAERTAEASIENSKAALRSSEAAIDNAKAAFANAHHALANVDLIEKGQIQERFKNAIDQLGSDKEAVNLGAIYTLHHIAKESDDLRKSVFDILCAYVRETT